MSGRIVLVVAGIVFAIIGVYMAISAVIGMLIWVAVFGVLAAAIIGAVKLTRWSNRSLSAKERQRPLKAPRVKGVVDCVGQPLGVGDTVRTGAQFDGPIELAVSQGTIVKLAHGKAHVRFDDAPEQIHPIRPAALRRLG